MTLLKASLVGASAALATLAATAASAATTYDFTLLDNNGVTVDASGVLTLTGDVIETIAGSVNGYGAITGLIVNPNSPSANTQGDILYDNLFDVSAPGVDNYGIFLRTAVGAAINLYNVNSWGPNVPDDTATVYVDGVGSVANGRFSVTAVPTAIPEPGAWALMLVGMGLAGATLRSHAKGDRAA
jgi:hypothetical protein